MKSPKEIYEKRAARYAHLAERQTKAANRISNYRLLTAFIGLAGAAALYRTGNFYLGAGFLLAAIVLFCYLVMEHGQLKKKRKYAIIFREINEQSLKRIKGEWIDFADTGEEFKDPEHPFAEDLDLFGEGSLFQWINTAVTYGGRQRMKEILLSPPEEGEVICRRQEAIEELAGRIGWRQRFLAEGKMISGCIQNPDVLFDWAERGIPSYRQSWKLWGVRILPAVTVLLGLFTLLFPPFPDYPVFIMLGVQYLLLRIGRKEREKVFEGLSGFHESIKLYEKMLYLFESRNFESPYLKELKKGLENENQLPAYKQIRRLGKIEDAISNRRNSYYFFMNILLLWDYQCEIRLEKWKEQSGRFLRRWLETIGELEALNSLAVIRFEHPKWVRPKFVDQDLVFRARGMGHPLLPESRVNNDLIIEKPETILLITGSNMSGKSTLLRTAGVNLVLAYAGAPVCASDFTCSRMNIYTSMRVSDNLEKRISSFYAELLKIKKMVRASERGERVFFLLDEVFKGTNSFDRHTGAKALIKKLSREGAIGLVSTHDLELGELEKEMKSRVKNYHFREYYRNGELYFDYKLRPGISTTRNALYLMKMAGIEIEE